MLLPEPQLFERELFEFDSVDFFFRGFFFLFVLFDFESGERIGSSTSSGCEFKAKVSSWTSPDIDLEDVTESSASPNFELGVHGSSNSLNLEL